MGCSQAMQPQLAFPFFSFSSMVINGKFTSDAEVAKHPALKFCQNLFNTDWNGVDSSMVPHVSYIISSLVLAQDNSNLLAFSFGDEIQFSI